MATSIRELRAELERANAKLQAAEHCLSRKPDAELTTGRIKGEDSKYSVRIWYRPNSCVHFGAITFHYPGQADSVTFYDDLRRVADAESGRSACSEESCAIRDLWFRVAQTIRAYERSLMAVA